MSQDDSAAKQTTRRKGGVRAIGQTLSKLTGAAYGRRGFAQGDVVRHWPEIAGELLARHTLPDRITFPKGQRVGGILHLQVGNSAVATEVQHLEPLIIEKVNTYFGYGAVKGVHLFQRPLPPKADDGPKQARPLTPAERARLERELETVTDPDLRRALEGLGQAVLRRRGGSG
jgi:hypothetical protein